MRWRLINQIRLSGRCGCQLNARAAPGVGAGAEHLAQLFWLHSQPLDWNHWGQKTALSQNQSKPRLAFIPSSAQLTIDQHYGRATNRFLVLANLALGLILGAD